MVEIGDLLLKMLQKGFNQAFYGEVNPDDKLWQSCLRKLPKLMFYFENTAF
jgi:hypothetical protein